MKIYAVHLLNDFSGSPKVLMQLIKGWQKHNYQVKLFTCKERKGFLSDIDNLAYSYFWYKLGSSNILKLIYLGYSQLILFLKLFFTKDRPDIIYVNTVLPFGAALAGKLRAIPVVYHIHETSIKPYLFKKFLFKIVRLTACKVIYVSNYLAEQENMPNVKRFILHNAIPKEFAELAKINRNPANQVKNLLMVCSLKAYKGINEFIELAKANSSLNFRMVLNATSDEVNQYFKEIPDNCCIYSTQTNLHPQYMWADLVLNLSKPDGWVETFGLTIIEGMAYGLPSIVPPIGGITELVEHDVNGYQIDSRNLEALNQHINLLVADSQLYTAMVRKSEQLIDSFSEDTFIQKNISIIKS